MNIGEMRFFGRSRTIRGQERAEHPALADNSFLGVEIELENAASLFPYQERYGDWSLITDGSLRNHGIELVLDRPQQGQGLVRALHEVSSMLSQHDVKKSWRCSVHVHMNIRDIDVSTLKKLILAYTVFEDILFSCGAKNRYKNNFCMPMNVAQSQLRVLSNAWTSDDESFVALISSRWSKYSALNLKPTTTLGTVELRIHNAETDFNELLGICNRLLILKSLAKNFQGSDENFIEFLSMTPLINIFNKSICLNHEIDYNIDRGVKNAYDILNIARIHVVNPHVRFETVLEQDAIDDIISWGEDAMEYETFEILENIDWESLSYDDICFLSNHASVAPNRLLSERDYEIYEEINQYYMSSYF